MSCMLKKGFYFKVLKHFYENMFRSIECVTCVEYRHNAISLKRYTEKVIVTAGVKKS